MPLAINPSDRKLLIIAGSILAVLAIALAFVAPPNNRQASPVPSTYSSASAGARAAYLLLKQLGYSVTVWDRPPGDLPEDPEGAVLIIANPTESPAEKERTALLDFALAGGRIVFTGVEINAFFPDANVSEEPLETAWRTYDARLPSPYTHGAPKIELEPKAEWISVGPSQLVLYGEQDSAAVVNWRVGNSGGEILWWADATPITNAGITHEDNLNFFLNSVSFNATGAGKPNIYWDEYFHGERTSLTSYIAKTPLPWGILQLCIIAIAVLVTFSRRSGPIAIPATVSRLAPLEFVDTLAGLYQRAHAEPAVVGIVYQRLRSGLIRQLRLSTTGSDLELGQAVSQRLGVNGTEFVRTMQRAAAASRDSSIPPAQAFTIVKQLEDYEEQFGLVRRKSQEKT